MRGLKTVLLFLIFAVLFFCAGKVFAAENDYLIINEFCSNPEVGQSEWIELYNPTNEEIDLSEYTIEDNLAPPKNLGSVLVPGNSYKVLNRGSVGGFTFNLNNTGDILVLKKLTVIVDQVAYGNYNDGFLDDNASVPEKGKSISRIPSGYDSDNDKSDFRQVTSTNGAENMLPIYSKDIIINEIVPSPDDGAENEFIELYNFGDQKIDLSNWSIDDIEGNSTKPYNISKGQIGPKAYFILCKTRSSIANCDDYGQNISLNDSGDSARLIDPNGDIVYTILYEKAEKGLSYSFDGQNWLWSEMLTPNFPNIIIVTVLDEKNNNIDKKEIREVKKLKKGELVKVGGKVISLPGDISKSYFYIQSNGSGIQIYNYYKDFPAMKYGDLVEVLGELSEVAGEKRLKSESIIVIRHEAEAAPREKVLGEIGEDSEGLLVSVRGEVVRPSGDTFYITDGTYEVKVQVKNDRVNKPKLRSGYMVSVEGIVSEYRGIYRLLSFKPESVKIIESNQLPRAGTDNKILILYFAPWILFLTVKMIRISLPKKSLKT